MVTREEIADNLRGRGFPEHVIEKLLPGKDQVLVSFRDDYSSGGPTVIVCAPQPDPERQRENWKRMGKIIQDVSKGQLRIAPFPECEES